MILLLIRHAKAEESHPMGDSFRRLSPKGLERLGSLVEPLREKGLIPEAHCTSPFVRARETAEFLRRELAWNTRLDTSDAVTPGSDTSDFAEVMGSYQEQGAQSVAVYTHNPFVSDLCRALLDWQTVTEDIVFHTPTALAMEVDPSRPWRTGRFLWILHPVD